MERINTKWWKSSHLLFRDDGPWKVGAKTRKFTVMNGFDKYYLGDVLWFTKWQRYCFFPAKDTGYSSDLLVQIADFTESMTDEHKDRLPFKAKRAQFLKERRKKRILQLTERKKSVKVVLGLDESELGKDVGTFLVT